MIKPTRSGDRNDGVFVLVSLAPVVGQMLITLLILNEARSRLSIVLWVILVWVIPIFGPLAYVLLGKPGMLWRQRLFILLVLLIFILLVLLIYAVGSARLS